MSRSTAAENSTFLLTLLLYYTEILTGDLGKFTIFGEEFLYWVHVDRIIIFDVIYEYRNKLNELLHSPNLFPKYPVMRSVL